jgi:bifunctional DNA-binding transcriptional regulator/antitoxin component of YhaV-PrlF toxin-antitoxin module
MPGLLLHDHGWLALPAELRQRLGLRTGDRLQIEMIEGGVRLRLAGNEAKAETAPPAPAPVVEGPLPAKSGRGRPRKQVPADPPMAEPQAELPLQAVEVQPEEGLPTAASAGKRAVGGRHKSKPTGTA